MRVFLALLPTWAIAAMLLGAGIAWAGDATTLGDAETTEETETAEEKARRIDALIERLGDEEYAVRQQAQAELARCSFDAFDALSAATEHDDFEVVARARYLLALLRIRWTTPADPPEVRSLLANYESLDLSGKTKSMAALAELPEQKGIPALCRLIRFEDSQILSRRAALAILATQPTAEPPDAKLAESLPAELGTSRRAAAAWLTTWLRFADEPDAAVDAWGQVIKDETTLLLNTPNQTDPTIIAGLLRFQVPWLQKLGRDDAALKALDYLIDLKPGDLEDLAETIDWLIKQRAWDAIERLIARFPDRLDDNPLLLYEVATALAKENEPQRAERMADRALALNPGEELTAIYTHYAVARLLWQRGETAWAEREFRHAIDTGPAGNEIDLMASSILGEMYHDEGRDGDAARVLERLVRQLALKPNLEANIAAELPSIRARMGFFQACHSESQGKRDEQRKHLAEATAADPTDLDVLIARYHLPDQTPEYRDETRELIESASEMYGRDIAASPGEATSYNQLAWLIANTEGNLDLALRLSKTSLSLDPDNGAYLDTLAHVHFARGEYERAVENQTKAVAQEPHRKEIAQKLETFRRKWEEEKKAQAGEGDGGDSRIE